MSSKVFFEVQASLLNSEDEPKTEIQRALEAIAYVAFMECDMRLGEFEQRAKVAFQTIAEENA